MKRLEHIYEDDNVLVVDKPAGISVHAGAGTSGDTVVDWLKGRIEDDGTERPGIVHRLDKDTSGVMIVAKNPHAKVYLQKQFKDRKVQKEYLALVEGVPKNTEAAIDLPLGRHPKNPLKRAVRGSGKAAQSRYKVLKVYKSKSLLEVSPSTGRTHQIRIHLAHIGHPVVGDRLYGKTEPKLKQHFLHAHKLTIKLPNGATQTFTSPLPLELQTYLSHISNG